MSFPKKRKHEVPLKWKKVFIWYKIIIKISEEVETSCPDVGKRYLLGRRLFLKVRIYIIRAVVHVGRANIPHKRAQKIGW